MYLEMFGFTEKPFHITPNPRFIFLSKNHKEAFAHLLYGIQQRVGFLSLSGEIGTGKTTVLRTLLGQLEDAEYRVALIFNPCLSAIELLQTIHREFAIDFDSENPNLVALHDSLNRFLLLQREAGKTVVLVVDEAQNLDPKVLEQLRLLSNLETETEKLIQMVLVGQPELDVLLQREDLRQLRQRLAVSYHLHAMDEDDTHAYVRHRAKIAGCHIHELFSAKALSLIYKNTGGTPRLVNILCDRALLVAYGRDSQSVSKADVQSAQKELHHQQKIPTRNRRTLIGGGLAVLILILVIAKLVAMSPPTAVDADVASAVNAPSLAEPSIALDEAAPVSVLVPQAAPIDDSRIESFIQQIMAIPTAESGLQSSIMLAEVWGLKLPLELPPVAGRRTMSRSLESLGLEVVEFQAQIEELLRLDVPVVLEITLPAVTGKRFLTLTDSVVGKVKTWPLLSEDGWLSIAELQELWFGKVLLPYRNFESVPLIDRRGRKGNSVKQVQQMLNRIESETLPVNGVYDQLTIEAVARFQRRMQLAPDGRVGAHTLFWLYRESGYEIPRLGHGVGI